MQGVLLARTHEIFLFVDRSLLAFAPPLRMFWMRSLAEFVGSNIDRSFFECSTRVLHRTRTPRSFFYYPVLCVFVDVVSGRVGAVLRAVSCPL